jgi:hypothetical protein
MSPMQRPLSDKTQQSQQTDIYPPGGIPTPNRSKRSATDPRLRPRGHWDLPEYTHGLYLQVVFITLCYKLTRIDNNKTFTTQPQNTLI